MKVAVFSYARTGSTILYEYIKKSLNHKGASPPFHNKALEKKFFETVFKGRKYSSKIYVRISTFS